MSKNVSKVVVLSSSIAERIGDADKMKIIVNAAVLDIESNFLPLEVMDIYINNQLVDTTTSDESGELTMTLQWDYHGDTEVIIQAEHKASGQKSLKKLLTLKEQSQNPIQVAAEEKIAETYGSPISKGAAIAAVKKNGLLLGDIKFTHHVDDVVVVTEAVKQNGLALEFASERLKKDIAIFNIAVEQNGDAASFAEEELHKKYITALENAKLHGKVTSQFNDTKPLVALAIKTNTNDFKNISDRLKDDENIVRLAVEKDGSLLQYASLNLKKNKDIVLLAIENMPNSILHADMAIQSDESIVLGVIKKDPNLLKDLPNLIKNSCGIATVAVQKNGLLLQYISEGLRNDKDIVLAAVKQNGLALKYASDLLKNTKKIVMEAISQNENAILHAGSKLNQMDKDIILFGMKNGKNYAGIPNDLLGDRDFFLKAIAYQPNILQIASSEIKNDKEVALAAINKDCGNIFHIDIRFRDNKDVMLIFLSKRGNIALVSERLKKDKDIIISAINSGTIELSKSKEIRRDGISEKIYLNQWGSRICELVTTFGEDKGIALALVIQNGLNLGYISYAQSDKNIALAAVKQNSQSIIYISPHLKNDLDIKRAAGQ